MLRDIEAQMLAYTDKIDYGKTFHEVTDEWESEHYEPFSNPQACSIVILIAVLPS